MDELNLSGDEEKNVAGELFVVACSYELLRRGFFDLHFHEK
jgi:hypothetical protein